MGQTDGPTVPMEAAAAEKLPVSAMPEQCLQAFQFHPESPPWLLARVRLLISITDMKYLLKLLD